MSTFNKKPPQLGRGILTEADGLINGPRNKSYGSFSDQAKDIASIYKVLDQRRIKSGERLWSMEEQVGWTMVITKLTREATAHKRDNFVDLCGYAELLCRLIEETDEAMADKERRLTKMMKSKRGMKALAKAMLIPARQALRHTYVVAPTVKWAEMWAQHHQIPRNRFRYIGRGDDLRGIRPDKDHRVVVLDWQDVKPEGKSALCNVLVGMEHFGPVEYWSSVRQSGGYIQDEVKGKNLT